MSPSRSESGALRSGRQSLLRTTTFHSDRGPLGETLFSPKSMPKQTTSTGLQLGKMVSMARSRLVAAASSCNDHLGDWFCGQRPGDRRHEREVVLEAVGGR